jgi:hypothetical protein
VARKVKIPPHRGGGFRNVHGRSRESNLLKNIGVRALLLNNEGFPGPETRQSSGGTGKNGTRSGVSGDFSRSRGPNRG